MIQEVVKESAEGESCPDAEKCDQGAKKLTSEANDVAAKFKKCDEINAKLTAQMAANAKLEAAMRGRLAKANAKLKELAAARKIRLKKKTALSDAATAKAKKLAGIAHKIAADPKNLK